MCKVSPHLRRTVRGLIHTRNGRVWISPHTRSATLVNDNCIIN